MSAILITGADGHLGRAVTEDLLARTENRVILFCRAADREERARKLSTLGSLAENPRCRAVFGDLSASDPFARVRRGDVSHVVHAAAATDFGIDRELAERVNVEGTRRVVEFARRCPKLERLVFLSSLYVAGLRDGLVDEVFFDGSAEFANHYEWSKWQAEEILRSESDLPWRIVRVGTILCDDESGRVSQQNVIHNTLKLLYYGLLSVVPGNSDTRVYLTTTRIAVDAILRGLFDPELTAITHVTAPGDQAVKLGDLLDRVYDAFMRDDRFARHGILKPLFCDEESFETLADSIDSFGGAMAQSLESIRPFAPQLFSDKDIRVNAIPERLDINALIDATCEHLTATRWGRTTEENRLCA